MDASVPVLALGVAALGVIVPPLAQLLTARIAAREAERARLFDYKRDAYLRVLSCLSELRALRATAMDPSFRTGDEYLRAKELHEDLKATVAELGLYAAPRAASAANDAVSFYSDALYNNSHKRRNATSDEFARLMHSADDTDARFVEAARADLGVRSGALTGRPRRAM